MACADYATALDAFTSFALFDTVFCFYANTLGASLTIYIFAFVTGVMLHLGTGSIIPTVVVGIITLPIIVYTLPAQAVGVWVPIMVIVFGIMIYLATKRLSNTWA